MLADVMIDGMAEAGFRQAIESLLREGRTDEAARRLKDELVFLCGDGLPLPARFRFISVADLQVTGWKSIVERIGELDSPGDPITAIGIDICGMQADFGGQPRLAFETTYYTDQSWGFSHADRSGLVAGYDGKTNAWQGSFEDLDDAFGLDGLDDLYAVVNALEQLGWSGQATIEERRAFVVAACYLAVLVHQAVRNAVFDDGLPRPMAVLVGSNESYPWFEAPAATARDPQPTRDHIPATSQPAPFSKPVLSAALAADLSAEASERVYAAIAVPPTPRLEIPPPFDVAEFVELENEVPFQISATQFETRLESFAPPAALAEPEIADYAPLGSASRVGTVKDEAVEDDEALHLPPPGIHITGTQLRRRFINRAAVLEAEETRKPGLLDRLLRRA